MSQTTEKQFHSTYDYDDLDHRHHSKWEFFAALFTLADIKVLNVWELANCYFPPVFVVGRTNTPWWLVKTEVGLIKIGRRKRVWVIDWEDTPIRKIITSDEVTKNETIVHAWTEEKLLEYLKVLREEMVSVRPRNQKSRQPNNS